MTNEEFEPIRIRIMKEAYDLADRNDTEGYNAIKVMCGDVQSLIVKSEVTYEVDHTKGFATQYIPCGYRIIAHNDGSISITLGGIGEK